MEILEQEYQKVLEAFPNAILVNNLIYHIKILLINNVFLDIDYKKYPKKPKVLFIKSNGEIYKDLDDMISSLKRWKKDNAISIVELINEILTFIENMQTNEILIKKELFKGILDLSRNQHPREILGLLRMEDGIVLEYILPPGALTTDTSGIFSSSRLPIDSSIEGSIHSHPRGNPHPSSTDLNGVFKKYRFNFIVASPYNSINCVKCFNKNGVEIPFRIVD